MINKDHQMARMFFSQGLDSCDRYSIKRLVDLWNEIDQPSTRASMDRTMRRCFNCMTTIVESKDDPEMIRLYSDFFYSGIGTSRDSITANYWRKIYLISQGFLTESIPDSIGNSLNTKVFRKSLLSTHFHSFITYTFSPTMPYGLTAGIYFDKIGGYVSYRTDYNSLNTAYECNNTKVPAIEVDNPPYEFAHEKWQSQMFTGGLLYPLLKNKLFVSAGGGLGRRKYFREIRTTNDKLFATGNKSEWCYNTEASYQGLTLEAGGMFVWKKLTLLGGVNSTRFKDLDVYLGLGLTF